MTDYCTAAQVGERLIMESADITTYTTQLNSAITEAMVTVVDVALKPYVTVPLTTIPTAIANITADFAASIFKRKYIPNEVTMRGTLQPDGLNDIDATGYFAMGMSKLERYIKSYYVLSETLGNTLHNPDFYLALLKQGIITGAEAREFMNAATSISLTKLETLTKTLTNTEVKNLTETDTITKTENKTATEALTKTNTETLSKTNTENHVIERTEIINKSKAQKRFAIIESNRDTNYYQKQEEGIYQDAEAEQERNPLDEGIYQG